MCKVSIIMSSYNSSKYIRESLESIINQNYENWECIVCDDKSTDDTVKITNEYRKLDDRIKLIQMNVNSGAASARNEGIKNSTGKYIAILDSDDISYSNRIKEQVEFLEKNNEYSFVGSKAIFFDGCKEWSVIPKVGKINREDLRFGMPLVHSTLMIRSSVIKEINGYPNYRRVQDYAMIMKVYSKRNIGYILDDYLVKYRCDEENYKRRTFKARLNEVTIRYKGYRELKYPIKYYLYALKPIISAIIPTSITKRSQQKRIHLDT